MSGHSHRTSEPPRWRERLLSRWRSRSLVWRLSVPVACACAGLLATTSMVNARGTDLRGGRHSDLIELVGVQRTTLADLRRQADRIQSDIDELTDQVDDPQVTAIRERVTALTAPAGMTAMTGRGLVVTLSDAPPEQPVPSGSTANALVVHQQDLQAVVNAFWAGDAAAVSLQGQRIISTTGVKCVGNVVVLQGVPYAPPYTLVALGDPTTLFDALVASPEVQTYRAYTYEPYNLGWSLRESQRLKVPAYAAPVDLEFATPSA